MRPGTRLRAVTAPSLDAVPGLVHGFERRAPGPARSRPAARVRVSAALAGLGTVRFLRQVHGASVTGGPWQPPPEADAAVVARPGELVAIETADCLPLLIVDPARRLAAAVHAGWRGTAAGIAGRAVAALVEAGADPASLIAAVGPGIGVCCFEVGDELREAFPDAARPFFEERPGGRPHLDLRGVNGAQLAAAGVRPERIEHVDECTFCRPADYFSFRRDGPGAGRMVNYVGWA